MQKTLKWMGIAALVLVVLPLGVVIAINAFDEKSNPWTASLGVFKPSAVPEAENAYVALITMAPRMRESGLPRSARRPVSAARRPK